MGVRSFGFVVSLDLVSGPDREKSIGLTRVASWPQIADHENKHRLGKIACRQMWTRSETGRFLSFGGLGWNLQRIGDAYDISRQRVSAILKRLQKP